MSDHLEEKEPTPKIYIYTGAGLSAESGIPTFRTGDGLWHNHDIDVVCNFQTWKQNYDLVHDFYNQRRADLQNVHPNAAHEAIARWQEEFGSENIVSVTTNVDDLLERAGVHETVHLHGHLTQLVNTRTGIITDIGYTKYDGSDKNVKPNVVFFGENAPEYQRLGNMAESIRPIDLVIFIGMSFQVIPPEYCLPFNHFVQSINVNPDVMTNYDHRFSRCINETAVAAIPELDKIIRDWIDPAV